MADILLLLSINYMSVIHVILEIMLSVSNYFESLYLKIFHFEVGMTVS